MGKHGAVFQSADGHQVAAVHIQGLSALGIGIDGHLGPAAADRIDYAAFYIEVAVGVQAVVAGGIGPDVSAQDGHVAGGVDGVVLGLGKDGTAGDFNHALALDGFVVGGGGYDAAGRHVQVAVELDALGALGIVVGRGA